MAAERLHEVVADYASGQEQPPLGGYATLMGLFAAIATAFSVWVHRSGRELPERVSPGDLALMTVATHKASRLLAKDRVTSAVRAPFTRYQAEGGPAEVEEQARGSGLRRAIGELLICPYCLGMWIATAFAIGLAVVPRPTRWVASVLAAHFGSDVLQATYRKLEDAA
ncbi:MAG: hypothetical protein QOC91_625 [Solirubrobacteraceae bacterium]|jgi:hypothetical protein|nr:hypothetical protein [Solirubrobacteraceae bacterium]MEA2153446.1 hypothetical protein [Solirubrobacteraceae bacterium]